MRRSKLHLVVIYSKPLRYSVFVLRVWKYPTPNANKQYVLTHIFWQCGVGRSSVGIATRYVVDGPGIESGGRRDSSAPLQTDPESHPPTLTMGKGSVLGVKLPGRSVKHPPPSSAEVKKRVGLYLYSPLGTSWPVPGWTLHWLPDVSKCCLLSEEPIPVRRTHNKL